MSCTVLNTIPADGLEPNSLLRCLVSWRLKKPPICSWMSISTIEERMRAIRSSTLVCSIKPKESTTTIWMISISQQLTFTRRNSSYTPTASSVRSVSISLSLEKASPMSNWSAPTDRLRRSCTTCMVISPGTRHLGI